MFPLTKACCKAPVNQGLYLYRLNISAGFHKSKTVFCDINRKFAVAFLNTGPTGFDSIVLCKCKHVVRCVVST